MHLIPIESIKMKRRLLRTINLGESINDTKCTTADLNPRTSLLENKKQDQNMKLNWSARARRRYFQLFIKGSVMVFIFLYVLVPVLIYLFPSIQGSIIFLSFVKRPWFADYERPDTFGLEATRNFKINSGDSILLGAWHILPRSYMKDSVSDSWYENSLKDGPPVVIYLHGNAGSRASSHRVELYKILRELDVHIIATDYRGYADSSNNKPTEDGLVSDAHEIFKWVKQRSGKSPIFIWGHSLGTGVATRMVSELNEMGEHPNGLVLEAPFNSMSDELFNHPFSKIFSFVPWYRWASLSALKANNALFESDKHITGITIPIIILHAEDDSIIPIRLGEKLYKAAVENHKKSSQPVSFIRFPAGYGYNHQHICRAANFAVVTRRFIDHPEEKILL